MERQGEMIDYALTDCGYSPEEFSALFTESDVCRRMENGEVNYLIGKSGVELFRECVYCVKGVMPDTPFPPRLDRSPAFWAGWALCYYQWVSGFSYGQILQAIPLSQIIRLYPTLHEADVTKFADVADRQMKTVFPQTMLQMKRRSLGLTQNRLSAKSGVSLRSIQMYEQRNKDINKAQADTLYRLSQALHCRMEDLLEKA